MPAFCYCNVTPRGAQSKGLGGKRRERERERDGSRGFVDRHRHSGCSAHGLITTLGRRKARREWGPAVWSVRGGVRGGWKANGREKEEE